MHLLKEKDKPVVRVLLNAGCCPRCVLRFCCVGLQSTYRQSYKDLMKELTDFARECNKPNAETEEENDPPCKKMKLEETEDFVESDKNGTVTKPTQECPTVQKDEPKTCVVCLGVLQHFCDKDFAKKMSRVVESANYQFSSLVISVSLPAQLSVREHAAWLLVKQEVGQQDFSSGKDDVIQIKEAYKWIIHPLISEELGVPVDGKSPFEVSVAFTHSETDGDCHFLASICSTCFKPAKNKQSVFTRMAVIKALEKIKEEDFRKQFSCPPNSPETKCDVQDIQCLHAPLYVAGRYNKYSRTLPQTPWVIDGERKMESSVEELISEPLLAVFRAGGLNFSSSGREDVDVRTLGNGRPFAIELLNPHRATFTKEEIKNLQQTINKSSDKIKVRDLQIVTREAMVHMKEGEEGKTKCYNALIWTEKAIKTSDIEFINNIKEFKIDQKTPLRVLHRRPLAVRPRIIHTMRAEFLDEHHFRLYLKTQAGTYIKEFVHGDFGRTKPNLCNLMSTVTDILELDVESVDVDWPPAIED
ncbi:putative tRNA pseudouridine synthase Pus10 [Polyodon spathula]|uniref:putative tRNA pseudouridine synthase Pus10 n=1 Tax=Polyodon spathula TaxID=7913 RepID=UPI001B7E9915|nr:putative tRNA pseudouridine synthase Pus10 [Polyodon spathula]XP_041108952.1 putative tRNA pseudouridine synthase Pus10 [Polyodon spathula]